MTNLRLTTSSRTTSILAVLFIVVGLAELIPGVCQAAQDASGADLGWNWVVTQYAIRGVNPYPVARDALRAKYGALAPRGPVHLADTRIYDIPKTGPHPQTDPLLGPPGATYPPTSLMMMVPFGFLPRDFVRLLWLSINVALLFLVARELQILVGAGVPSFLFFLGMVVLWPATSYCIEREQLSLLCLACILLARRLETNYPVAAGLLYSLSLVKPSLSLPFLFLPLLDKRTKTLATIVASQLTLLCSMAWLVRANPFHLLGEWLSVAAYFRQGMYTVQDIINKLRLDGSVWDTLLQLTLLIGGGIIAARFSAHKRIAFLAIISCTWTYHARYDFVVLLIPAALLAVSPIDRRWALNLTTLVIVGLGLTMAIYSGTGNLARAMREAARLSLAALAIGVAWGEIQTRRAKVECPAHIRLE